MDAPDIIIDRRNPRTKKAEWDLGPAADYHGKAGRRFAVFSLYHYSDRHMFAGSIRNVFREDVTPDHPYSMESTSLFDCLQLGRIPCPRYSPKQRDAAFDLMLAGLLEAIAANDPAVMQYLTPQATADV